jgi:hypothetical protein
VKLFGCLDRRKTREAAVMCELQTSNQPVSETAGEGCLPVIFTLKLLDEVQGGRSRDAYVKIKIATESK